MGAVVRCGRPRSPTRWANVREREEEAPHSSGAVEGGGWPFEEDRGTAQGTRDATAQPRPGPVRAGHPLPPPISPIPCLCPSCALSSIVVAEWSGSVLGFVDSHGGCWHGLSRRGKRKATAGNFLQMGILELITPIISTNFALM